MSEQQVKFNLKGSLINSEDIGRDDLIFTKGNVWICMSKNLSLYQNMQTRQQLQLKDKAFIKMKKLQLIPLKWEVVQDKITLQGRQLGLGSTHKVKISWMRPFKQMQVIKQQKQKGRDIRHKVILCQTTQPQTYLIVGIDLL